MGTSILNKLLAILRPASAIYVVNESTVVSDADVKKWCKAVQKQIKRDVVPAWGGKAKTVRFISSPAGAPKNGWVIAVLDDADQAGALGYHTTDDKGRVYGRVFAKTAQDYGYSASQTFSHEVLETWGDPGVDKWVQATKQMYSVPVELCDAVEGDQYSINGVVVSNFVFPAWFGKSGGTGYDQLGTAPAPFKVAPNGYTVVQFPNGSTTQIFGETYDRDYSRAKAHEVSRSTRRRS